MANIVFNIAKGRVVEFYNRVENNDPGTSALILIPIETSGLEADSVLIDKDDLAAVLSGTTNEQTTMGRKTRVELATTIADAANGQVEYTIAAGDLNEEGAYLLEFEIDKGGGLTDRAPSRGRARIFVEEAL